MKASNISRSTRTEVRVAKTLFIMVSIFTSSYLPGIISNLLVLVDPSLNYADLKQFSYSKYKFFKGFFHIAFVVVFYNSFWNFFIYQRNDRDFKKSLEMLKKRVMSIFGIDYQRGVSPKRKTIQSHTTPISTTGVTELKTATNVSTVM